MNTAERPIFVIGVGIGGNDEGYAILARQLARRLARRAPTQLISIGGRPAAEVTRVPDARPLISAQLILKVWRERPQLIYYLWPATVPALLRSRLLTLLSRGGHVIVLAPQPVPWRAGSRLVARFLWPRKLLVQSAAEEAIAATIGPTGRFGSGVDLGRFRPASPAERACLRRASGLPEGRRVVLHVGHLNRSRNLDVLVEIARRPGLQPVLLASGLRFPESDGLARRLRPAGVIVFSGYRSDVEDLYRAADCYVFPVHGDLGAIAMPLSVLEALACDVPVVTTRFGVLPELFEGCAGVSFVDDDADFPSAVMAQLGKRAATRHLVERFSWDACVEEILARSLEPPAANAAATRPALP